MYGKSSRHRRRRTNCASADWKKLFIISDHVLNSSLSYSLKLKSLHRFTSTASAVEEVTAIQEGKLGKGLKQFLSDEIISKGKGKEQLLVADNKLGAHPPCHLS